MRPVKRPPLILTTLVQLEAFDLALGRRSVPPHVSAPNLRERALYSVTRERTASSYGIIVRLQVGWRIQRHLGIEIKLAVRDSDCL